MPHFASRTALDRLGDVYPEAAVQIEKIVDLVFPPNELWRLENYGDKFFAELFSRIDGLAEYAREHLREEGLEVNPRNMKEAADFGHSMRRASEQ